jgi:hypothetical protein
MLRKASDYRPVKLPFSKVAQLGFNHWRTEWRLPSPGEEASAFMGLLGCGSSTWEIYNHELSAFLRWNWVVLEGGLISLTDPSDIRSNVVIMGEGDRNLPMHDSSALLMSTIHSLPWREEVDSLIAFRARRAH